jgi:hypothetical protein
MRTLNKNKQQMYYSLPLGEQPIYELDKNGKKKIDYVDEEGNIYYRETGESEMVYSTPVPFQNGISGKLSEILVKEFGIDDTSMYAEMDMEANKFPIVPESLIWLKSEPKYKDADRTIPDKKSCDYVVVGVLDEGLSVWNYLLRRNLK